MNAIPFQPQGPTVLVLASSTTDSAATQISTANQTGAMLSNPSTFPIYALFGSSAVAAAAPTTALSSNAGMCIPPGLMSPVTIAPSSSLNWISAVTSGGGPANLFVTPGYGV